MRIQERIEQAQVWVRSGIRLLGFLLLVVISAFFFGVSWLLKLSVTAAGLFTIVTLLQYWIARRLEGRIEPPSA